MDWFSFFVGMVVGAVFGLLAFALVKIDKGGEDELS